MMSPLWKEKRVKLHLYSTDWIPLGLALLVLTFLSALIIFPTEHVIKMIAIFFLCCITIGTAFEAYRRMEDWGKQSRRDYEQVEALFFLYQNILFRAPLPRMRGWAISPDFAVCLLRTIREQRPKTVVDLGSGVSTVIAGYCVEQQGSGKVYALDHEVVYAEKNSREIARHGLASWAEVFHAPLVRQTFTTGAWQWYDLPAATWPVQIDLLIVDGPPDRLQPLSRYPALPFLRDRMSAHAMILIDDANNDAEQDMIRRWLEEFPEWKRENLDAEKGAVLLRRI